MIDTDLEVLFPARGVIRLKSHTLFGDTDSPICRRFLERVLQAEEISDIRIRMGDCPVRSSVTVPRHGHYSASPVESRRS